MLELYKFYYYLGYFEFRRLFMIALLVYPAKVVIFIYVRVKVVGDDELP